jgi:hypothetical protein
MGKGEKMNNESCRREPCNEEMWRKRKKKWWNKAKEQKSENVLERVRGGKR